MLHVDDFLVTGSNRFHDLVVQHVVTKFKVGKRQEGSFRYVGLKITKTSTGIRVNQDNYSQKVLDINIDQKERTNDDKLNLNELRMLRSIIGQIQWVSSQTRPDLSFDALDLSIERNRATITTLKRAKKVIKKLKWSQSEIMLKPVGDSIKLKAYPDAGFCNLSDGTSSTQGSDENVG